MLTAENIVTQAEDRVGAQDSDVHLHRNLDALLASIQSDGKLSDLGLASAERGLVARTGDRIEGLKWIEAYPEIADEEIVAPVFLTGLPRSGTTYFQYLFDVDYRFRLIRTWEALMPNPPPGFDAASVVQRKAQENDRCRQMRPKEVEGFAALHLHDEDGSEECHAFMEHSYGAAGFSNLYDAPTYFDYLMSEADLTAIYQVHKRQLQLLQWRSPQPRWALKYPNHVIGMDAIVAVYPDARFAMTHRDPVQTLASIAKMSLALRTARYDAPVDPHRIGVQMLDFVRRHIERIMAFCTGPEQHRVQHVDYYALIANPVAEVESVQKRLGIDTPPEVRQAMADWRVANPKGARGSNDYALDQFGVRAEEALDLYGDYMRHFDIPRESEGLTRIGASA